MNKFTDFTPEELADWFTQNGEKTYRANQLNQWIYQKRLPLETLTNFSSSLREKVSQSFDFSLPTTEEVKHSKDGTMKLLIRLHDNSLIETVLMNHGEYWTICVSSQVGCAMGCKFCMTGTMGLKRNLTNGEIIDQVLLAGNLLREEKGKEIKNIVFMGMGEPLHNFKFLNRALVGLTDAHSLAFGPRRITVSTSGLAERISRFANQEKILANLAVSLNAPSQKQREQLMPIGKKHNLPALMEACKEFAKVSKRKITFEYILMRDVNDSEKDAKALVGLLSSFPNKLNLILYNDNPGLGFFRPEESRVYAFQKYMLNKGVLTTQRHSKGQDIAAACGQLVTQRTKSKTGLNA